MRPCARLERQQREAELQRLTLPELMARIPREHARRWCDSALCACLGCVNRGPLGIERFGHTKAAWEQWRREAGHV